MTVPVLPFCSVFGSPPTFFLTFFCTHSSKVKTTFKRKHEGPPNGHRQGLTDPAIQNCLKDSYHPQDLLLNLTEFKKKKKKEEPKKGLREGLS